MNIRFAHTLNHVYTLSLYNSVNQLISKMGFVNGANGLLQIPRTRPMGTGLYIVEIIDQNTNERFVQKVIFE